MNHFKKLMDSKAGNGGVKCDCCGGKRRCKYFHRIARRLLKRDLQKELLSL